MADVVRNGAIFRVKNPSTMRSPMPRLPIARGRIANATPETPAAKRGAKGRVRSALERVGPRASVAPLPPQQQQRPAANYEQQRPMRRLKKVNKKGVAPRKVQPSKDEDDASVRASFNRLVSESETRQAAKRAESDSSGSKAAVRKDAAATTSEEGEEAQSVEEREASSDTGEETPEEQQPRARGRKRPRVEPEDEPTEEEDEEEEEEDASSEEMVTPQPRRRKDESASDSDGTGDEDEDGVTVQKRLVYDDTPPAKAKAPPPKRKAKPATTPVQRKPKAKAKTSREKVPVAAGGLEFLSMSSAATPSRSTRIRTGVLLMSEWYVDWPPPFEGDQLQLVVHGQVLGQSSSFTVQRRVTDVQFVSTDNQNVRLNGCLDIERAQQADVPPVVMELLVEGIPTNWRQLLDAYAPPPDPWMPLSVKSKEKAKQKKARAAAAAEVERQASVPIPGVTKPTPKSSKKSTTANASPLAISDPMTPAVEKRSRSGRRLTPVMEWWRNERKVVDLNFETKIVEGSPAYLPSKRSVAMSDAAKAARMKIQEIYDAQRKSAEWSDAQLTALHDAKVQVPTTHASFWVEVAKRVPGKSADECRARSFDDLPVAPTRKGTGGGRAAPAKQQQAASQVPVKIHRAGSNLFKKQVRQFVRDQEQKNVDDLFSLATPSKDAIAGGDFDDLKSPDAPMVESRTQRDGGGDESDEDGGPGRELLEKVPLSKRDDVDSYVRNLKRGNEALGLKAVRTSNAASADFTTPQAKKKPRREGVHMTTEVGTHVLEGIVTPNGTTRVLVERGSDDEEMGDTEDEEDEEAALSDTYE